MSWCQSAGFGEATKYFSVQISCDCWSSNACFGSIQEIRVLLFWRRILKLLPDQYYKILLCSDIVWLWKLQCLFGSIQEVHVLLFWRRILKFLQDLHWISYQIYITIIHSCVCKNILVPFLSALVVCFLKLWKNSRLWDLLFTFSYCLPVSLLESSHFVQADT